MTRRAQRRVQRRAVWHPAQSDLEDALRAALATNAPHPDEAWLKQLIRVVSRAVRAARATCERVARVPPPVLLGTHEPAGWHLELKELGLFGSSVVKLRPWLAVLAGAESDKLLILAKAKQREAERNAPQRIDQGDGRRVRERGAMRVTSKRRGWAGHRAGRDRWSDGGAAGKGGRLRNHTTRFAPFPKGRQNQPNSQPSNDGCARERAGVSPVPLPRRQCPTPPWQAHRHIPMVNRKHYVGWHDIAPSLAPRAPRAALALPHARAGAFAAGGAAAAARTHGPRELLAWGRRDIPCRSPCPTRPALQPPRHIPPAQRNKFPGRPAGLLPILSGWQRQPQGSAAAAAAAAAASVFVLRRRRGSRAGLPNGRRCRRSPAGRPSQRGAVSGPSSGKSPTRYAATSLGRSNSDTREELRRDSRR